MSNTQTTVIDDALQDLMKFTPQQRLELADRLVASVPMHCGDPEIERAWNEEITRRIEDIEQGRVETISAKEAIKEAREHVREVRKQASGGPS